MQQSNPVKFEEQLKNRKLSGNIQEYYKSIWDEAKMQAFLPEENKAYEGI